MGDPVGAAKYAYDRLNDGGAVILIEPTANDKPEENFNIYGQMYYSFSPWVVSQSLNLRR